MQLQVRPSTNNHPWGGGGAGQRKSGPGGGGEALFVAAKPRGAARTEAPGWGRSWWGWGQGPVPLPLGASPQST